MVGAEIGGRMAIKGQINGQDIDMFIDSGCSRTLVHEKFVHRNQYTGEVMTVLMANGVRNNVPLAWVNIKSQQGNNKELVGVMQNLPFDCLLGLSSFGRTLTKKSLLEQWDQCVGGPQLQDIDNEHAFVITRRQMALRNAQARLDNLLDKQNQLTGKSLK
jgi:hypothetical protein